MSKLCRALALVLTILCPSVLRAADETEWKPESEEAALQILRQCRQSLGKLGRFEIECLQSQLDLSFGEDCRARLHLSADLPTGYVYTVRPVGPELMHTSHRDPSGAPHRVRSERSETWFFANGRLTTLDDKRRTYDVAETRELFGWPLIDWPQMLFIPPWLDQTVGWDDLQSRFRVVRAASTSDRFFVEFAPFCKDPEWPKGPGWRIGEDARLRGAQSIVINRQTLRPMRWRRKCLQPSSLEYTLLYTRFDINTANHELKVDLAGYREVSLDNLASSPEKSETEWAPAFPALWLCGRLAFGLIF
jgi:hypothetical protein